MGVGINALWEVPIAGKGFDGYTGGRYLTEGAKHFTHKGFGVELQIPDKEAITQSAMIILGELKNSTVQFIEQVSQQIHLPELKTLLIQNIEQFLHSHPRGAVMAEGTGSMLTHVAENI